MNKLYLTLLVTLCALSGQSQIRMAILGGPHSASVKETNSLPDWETSIKPGYASRPGLNLGILTEIPLSANSRWYLQPGILYMAKGRKFFRYNDSTVAQLSDTVSSAQNLSVNYIDIPLNLAYKIPLGKKAKFLLSAGPWIGFFYNGKQVSETKLYASGDYQQEESKLETGNEAGKMKTINAGFNARAGFELGNVLLTGFYSEGLSSFQTASYPGTFRHQVRGVSVGIWLNKAKVQDRREKDSDKDGIPDKDDACPGQAGPLITNGCPDSDGDGVADNKDKCPEIAGKIRFDGCPVPDKDNDGVTDEADECPTEAGPVENKGCPGAPVAIKTKVEIAARNIFFKANSDRLTESSYAPLDEVADLLLASPELRMSIEGHTDSTGSAELNKKLSSNRARSVKRYLVSKGVDPDRLRTSGFGPTRPLVSNATLELRRKNRRVELKLE